MSEKQPLLGSGRQDGSPSSGVKILKHITLLQAVGIMVGSCSGAGIFVSPTGVTASAGSVGVSIIIWGVCGLLNLVLALCYAELGSALPIAGGDYAYIKYVLGGFPAFLCLWVLVVLVAPAASAIMGRTVGAYFITLGGANCQPYLVIVISSFVLVTAAGLNMFSVKWATRLVTVMSFGKIGAMLVIIIVGIVKLLQGYTDNFEDIFAGTSSDPGSIVVAFLPGFVTYVGWDCINALAEEMKNPQRDLPIAAVISLVSVTAVYVLINVAYFTMLTPQEFVASDAVATNFAEKAIGGAAWIIPVFVMLASTGSAFNFFLAAPRWTFAGGREGQLPRVLSFVHIQYLSPVPAILFMLLLSIFFSSATFLDVQALLEMTGLIMQLKIALALVALLHLKRTKPEMPRTIKVPFLLVLFSLVVLLVISVIAIYQSPLVNGIGLGLFLLGAPFYLLQRWLSGEQTVMTMMDSVTCFLQKLLYSVPEHSKQT